MRISFKLSEAEREQIQKQLSLIDEEAAKKGFELRIDVEGKCDVRVVVSHSSCPENCNWSAAYPPDIKIIQEGIGRHEKVSHQVKPISVDA